MERAGATLRSNPETHVDTGDALSLNADACHSLAGWPWEPIPDEAIDDLRRRLSAYRPPIVSTAAGWDRGVPTAYLQTIVDYWSQAFDWRAQEARIRSLPWVNATVGGREVTAVHQRSDHSAARAVVLLHGWPDSVLRFERALPLLTGYHVVVPCLAGFPGAASTADRVASPSVMADEVAGLMTELGYDNYIVSGGDVGAVVAQIMATRYPEPVAALHLTDLPAIRLPARIRDELDQQDQEYYRAARRWRAAEGGYLHEQATRPHTLAVALSDSPVGLAAWIIEKLRGWSDSGDDVETVFSRDDLLTWVSVYWFTRTIGTSFDPYSALALEYSYVSTPTAVTMFDHGLIPARREHVERFFDVRFWESHRSGGHFAAWERPADFVRGVAAAVAASE
jgi:pimeloyl-ACP methyl ester carboxylesterase